MGMLDRYKKTGGFVQLLNLIETCGPAKQEKFLKLVNDEDPTWSDAIQKKMLTVEKIFSWNEQTLADIFSRIQDLTLATIMHGTDAVKREKISKFFSHAQKRKVEDLYNSSKPSPAEISTAFVKLMQEVREMVKHGYLRFDKIDPELFIEEDIEEKLSHSGPLTRAMEASTETTIQYEESNAPAEVAHAAPVGNHAHLEEVSQLKKKMNVLTNEISTLKSENRTLKDKLEQIKRIA